MKPQNCIGEKIYEAYVIDLEYKWVERVGGDRYNWKITGWRCVSNLSFYGALYIIMKKYDCAPFGMVDGKIIHPYNKPATSILGASQMWAGKATFALISLKRKPHKDTSNWSKQGLTYNEFSVDTSFQQAQRLGKIIEQYNNGRYDFLLRDGYMMGVNASMPKGYQIVTKGKVQNGDYAWMESVGRNELGYWHRCKKNYPVESKIGTKLGETTGYMIMALNKKGKEYCKHHERHPNIIVIRKESKKKL